MPNGAAYTIKHRNGFVAEIVDGLTTTVYRFVESPSIG
jgi:hypothetical protein